MFRLTRFAYVRHMLIPHTVGATITGLRLSMGTAWMVIVAVEMMSGKTGIGNYVWNSYNAGDMSKVTASIVLIGATGLILDLAFMRLGHRFVTKETHVMTLEINDIWKAFAYKGRRPTSAAWHRPDDRTRRVRLADRPFGLRQVDLVIDRRRVARRPTAGTVTLDGAVIDGASPDRAMVFQNYSLLPRLSLEHNVDVAVSSARPEHTPSERADAGAKSTCAALAFGNTATNGHTRCRAACSNAAPSPAPSPSSLGCCCSTSRSVHSTP